MVEVTDDTIRIYDKDDIEIVGWIKDEWKKDENVVLSIVNSINIFYTEGADVLKNRIGK